MKFKTTYKLKINIDTFKLIVYDSLIFINTLLESMYSEIESVTRVLRLFRYFNVGLMFGIFLLTKKQKQNRLIVIAVIFVCSAINYLFKNGSIGLMMALGIVMICNELPPKKIILHTIVSSIFSYGFVIVSALSGIITNITIVRYLSIGLWQGRYDRQALGFQFPNQIPLMFFYIAAVVILGLKSNFKFVHAAVLMCINLLIYTVCNARTPFLLVISLILLSFIINSNKNISKKVICTIPLLLTPLVFIGSFVLTIGYPSINLFQKIDRISNNRLSSAYLTIKHWGITFFGSGVEAGTKATDIKNVFSNNFSVNVDNGYIIFLLQYGLLLTFLLFGVFLAISIKIYYDRDVFFSVVFSIVLLSNLIDANLVSFRMWPMIMLFMSNYKNINYQEIIQSFIISSFPEKKKRRLQI